MFNRLEKNTLIGAAKANIPAFSFVTRLSTDTTIRENEAPPDTRDFLDFLGHFCICIPFEFRTTALGAPPG